MPCAKAAAHEKMGLNDGGIVVTRPDGHVGCVVALEEGNRTVEALESYFNAFTTAPRRAERPNGSGLGGGIEDVRAKL